MSEETWHEARLIPTSGIGGADEQERRATSALLAVLGVVPEFSKTLLSPLGAPVRQIDSYIEVPFDLDGKKVIPDGLIRVQRGSRQWTALVEVKTGKNELKTEQLEHYLDVARAEKFDCLITISNEIPAIAGDHPTAVDKRKLRNVAIHHWSWSFVLATAIVQKEHRGVADPEQAWILGELIRYLEHEKSGALELDDMGSSWVTVRESVANGTLRATDKTAPEVTSRFDALLQYAGLRLGRQLGTDVSPLLTRHEVAAPAARAKAQVTRLASDGTLVGTLRIPHAIAPVVITADLRANRVSCSVQVPAPQEGRATTRVNWLLRQLRDARGDVRIEAFVARAKTGSAELIKDAREDPKILISDPTRDLRSFTVSLSAPLGAKRGRGRGAFIDSVLDVLDVFYADVVQHLKPWAAAPPRLRDPEAVRAEPAEISSTGLSSQDGPSDDI